MVRVTSLNVVVTLICSTRLATLTIFLQAIEFFFFAVLIGVITLLFAIMSYFYKYGTSQEGDKISHDGQKDESTALIPEGDTGNNITGKEDEAEKAGLDDETEVYHSESEF